MQGVISVHLASIWLTAITWDMLVIFLKLYSEVKAVPAICHGGTRGGRRYSSFSYLTLALDGGWVVSVKPRPRFTPFGTHWIRGWAGPRAGLDAGARRSQIILCPSEVRSDYSSKKGCLHRCINKFSTYLSHYWTYLSWNLIFSYFTILYF
jgi:hypothetical protein